MSSYNHPRLSGTRYSVSGSIAVECREILPGDLLSGATALACYDSLGYNLYNNKEMLKGLIESEENNSKKNSALIKDLVQMSTKNYSSDRAFSVNLTVAYNHQSVPDHHYHHSCFNQFKFVQPFPVQIISNLENTHVEVVNQAFYNQKMEEYWKKVGLHPWDYIGLKIQAIEDIDPIKFLEKYGLDQVGMSKDNSARLNIVSARLEMTGLEGWKVNPGSFYETNIPPAKSKLKFTFLIKGFKRNIYVPYLAIAKSKFQRNRCLNHEKVSKTFPKKFFSYNGSDHHLDPSYSVLDSIKGNFVRASIFDYGLGVISIAGFLKENRRLILDEFAAAAKLIAYHKPPKIFFDLSGGYGDDICIVNSILKYLEVKSLNNECAKYIKKVTDTFPSKKIALVSNSLCWGACASLAEAIISKRHAISFSVGGIPNVPGSIASVSNGIEERLLMANITLPYTYGIQFNPYATWRYVFNHFLPGEYHGDY